MIGGFITDRLYINNLCGEAQMPEEYLYIRASINYPGFKNFIESLGRNPTALLRKIYGNKIEAQLLDYSNDKTFIAASKRCSEMTLGQYHILMRAA